MPAIPSTISTQNTKIPITFHGLFPFFDVACSSVDDSKIVDAACVVSAADVVFTISSTVVSITVADSCVICSVSSCLLSSSAAFIDSSAARSSFLLAAASAACLDSSSPFFQLCLYILNNLIQHHT